MIAITNKRSVRLTEEDVEKIALLARIELDPEEKSKFLEQFNQILEFFEKIDEAGVEDLEPTFHVLDIRNVFREDEVGECLSQEEALMNAPRKEDGFFKAPRIVG